jgi:quinol monooxygenase YgiN
MPRPEEENENVVIVAGSFEIKPDERDEFLAGRHDAMRESRSEPGCLEYTMSADPIDPGRVVLFERWADQASLDVHMAAMRNAPRSSGPTVAPISATITIYDVAGERPLGM